MSEKNISIVKQHLEKHVKIFYIMLEIAKYPLAKNYFETQERTEKTRESRQDRIFGALVRTKLESQDAVDLKALMLQASLRNLEIRYNRFLILDGENGLRMTVRAQRAEYNPEIMPDNFIECLIVDNSKKKLTRLKLNNNPDKPLIVNNFPYSALNWEQGDAFRFLYKGLTGAQEFEDIGSEKVTDEEEIDILLNRIQTSRINKKLTQKTAESWLNSDISVSTMPTITPVNALGQRFNFAKVTV